MHQELLLCAYRLQALITQKHYRARQIDVSSRKLISLITELHPEPLLPNPLPVSKEDIDQDLEFLATEVFKSREISLDTEKFKNEIREEVRGVVREEVKDVVREEIRGEFRGAVREEMREMNDKRGKEEIERDVRKREEDSERGLIESAIRGYQRTMMTTNWGSPTARTRW